MAMLVITRLGKWNAIQVFNTRHSFLMTNDHNLGGSRDPRPAMVQPSAGWIWSWAMECPEALAPQGCKPWNKASWRLSWAMPWPWGWLILGFCLKIDGQQEIQLSNRGPAISVVVIAGLDFPRVARNSFAGKLHFCWKKPEVSCRFSLKEHVRDAVFSLNSFSGLWIMWACCWKWVVHPHDFMANTAWKAKCTICGQTRIGSVCQLKLVWCQKLWLKETRRCCQPTECCPVWVSPFIYTWLESRWGCRGSQRFTQILQSQEDTSDTSASFHAGPGTFLNM